MVLDRTRTKEICQEDGFTLIELLVVMLIIGILSAMAVPTFLNQRKEAVDSSTRSTLLALASKAELVAPRNGDTEDLTMDHIKAMDPGVLDVGTIVGVTGNLTGGFCLSAYRLSGGTYTQDQPLILDSKLSNRFVYNTEDLGGGACDPDVWGTPIQPAYEVKAVDGKPTLVPSDSTTPRTNACHGVTPYTYGPEFRAATTSGEHVSLDGSISLSDDCRVLRYNLRVVRASADAQYNINLATMNGTQGGWSSGVASTIAITGKAESKGVVETGWKETSNWDRLVLAPSLRDGRYARDIIWEPQP